MYNPKSMSSQPKISLNNCILSWNTFHEYNRHPSDGDKTFSYFYPMKTYFFPIVKKNKQN